MEVEVELAKIIINENADQQIIVLVECDGDRSFPIVIGLPEAVAIDRRLKGIELPRPMTHDLLANVIDQMGGTLERVVIIDLLEHTFYACLEIEAAGNRIQVDSRPSDAIAIGVGMGVPIFVDEQIFDKMQM